MASAAKRKTAKKAVVKKAKSAAKAAKKTAKRAKTSVKKAVKSAAKKKVTLQVDSDLIRAYRKLGRDWRKFMHDALTVGAIGAANLIAKGAVRATRSRKA